MKFNTMQSDVAVLAEMGRRLAALRLEQQITQAQLAQAAGISKSTVERLEDGSSAQMSNLIRYLRALGKLESLEGLLPDRPLNPITLLKGGEARTRVRLAKTTKPAPEWVWGDE